MRAVCLVAGQARFRYKHFGVDRPIYEWRLPRTFPPEVCRIGLSELLRVARVVLVLKKAPILLPPAPASRLLFASCKSLIIFVNATSSFYFRFVIF